MTHNVSVSLTEAWELIDRSRLGWNPELLGRFVAAAKEMSIPSIRHHYPFDVWINIGHRGGIKGERWTLRSLVLTALAAHLIADFPETSIWAVGGFNAQDLASRGSIDMSVRIKLAGPEMAEPSLEEIAFWLFSQKAIEGACTIGLRTLAEHPQLKGTKWQITDCRDFPQPADDGTTAYFKRMTRRVNWRTRRQALLWAANIVNKLQVRKPIAA